MSAPGRVWGIGVGPGDPDLMTIKACRILERVDVVAFPAPLDGDSLARRIAATHIRPGAEDLPMRMSMDPRSFPQKEVYDRAHREITAHVERGHKVAVLCEGDPFFYGSFMYLFERLAGSCRVEIVPGVSSLTACAAELAFPLAARNDVLSVIPATLAEDDLAGRLKACDVAAIIKVGRHLPKVRRVLERTGLLAHAQYVERATMAEQRTSPLGAFPDETAPYFSMILTHSRGRATQ